MDNLNNAARDVLAERERQKTAEGWTTEHDDTHKNGELSLAAASYAIGGRWTKDRDGVYLVEPHHMPIIWPWSRAWWKPTDRRRNLVKAAALILAEIERLDRLALEAPRRYRRQQCITK